MVKMIERRKATGIKAKKVRNAKLPKHAEDKERKQRENKTRTR